MPRAGVYGNLAPSVSITAARLRAPPQLSELEARAFAELVASVRPQHFEACDLPMLCEYSRLIVFLASLWKKFEVSGDSDDFAKITAAQKSMFTAARLLRLTPSARAPNRATPQQRHQSYTRNAKSGSAYDQIEVFDEGS